MPLSLAVHSVVNQDCVMVTKVAIIGKSIIVYVYHVYLPKFYHTVEPLITDPVRKNPFRNRKNQIISKKPFLQVRQHICISRKISVYNKHSD